MSMLHKIARPGPFGRCAAPLAGSPLALLATLAGRMYYLGSVAGLDDAQRFV